MKLKDIIKLPEERSVKGTTYELTQTARENIGCNRMLKEIEIGGVITCARCGKFYLFLDKYDELDVCPKCDREVMEKLKKEGEL